jgi:hypothetical protein
VGSGVEGCSKGWPGRVLAFGGLFLLQCLLTCFPSPLNLKKEPDGYFLLDGANKRSSVIGLRGGSSPRV